MSREVPEGWRAGKFDTFITLQRGFDLPVQDRRQGMFAVIASNGQIDNHAEPRIPGPAVVTGRSGTLGKVFLISEGCWPLNTTLYVKDFHGNNPEFVTWFLKQFKLDRFGTGTGVPTLNRNVVHEVEVAFPPLHEQRRIAEILSSVDEAIAATRAVIEQTRKVKQSVLERLLTKGIDQTCFKQTDIGEIPVGWKVGRLDDFFVLQRGFDLPVQSRTPGDFPVIASNGEIAKHSEQRVGGPAVITGRSGTLGKVFFYQMACWPLNTTLYVKDFKSNNAEFVYYFLQYFDLGRFGTGTGVPTLNRNDVHSQVVAFPPPEEQPDIVSVLRGLDENLDAEHAQLHQLNEVKSALMSDLLTGRKRVTDALPMAAE